MYQIYNYFICQWKNIFSHQLFRSELKNDGSRILRFKLKKKYVTCNMLDKVVVRLRNNLVNIIIELKCYALSYALEEHDGKVS